MTNPPVQNHAGSNNHRTAGAAYHDTGSHHLADHHPAGGDHTTYIAADLTPDNESGRQDLHCHDG
jgi:hypothetical protein